MMIPQDYMLSLAELADVHRDLPVGTLVRHVRGTVARVTSMHGDFAACHRVRHDGGRDRRFTGWSGSLPKKLWTVLP